MNSRLIFQASALRKGMYLLVVMVFFCAVMVGGCAEKATVRGQVDTSIGATGRS